MESSPPAISVEETRTSIQTFQSLITDEKRFVLFRPREQHVVVMRTAWIFAAAPLIFLTGCSDSIETLTGLKKPELRESTPPPSELAEVNEDELEVVLPPENKDLAKISDTSIPSYPFQRTLTDRQNRSIDVTILGKAGDQIAFERNPTGQQFVLPLEKLSDNDRYKLRSFPDGGTLAVTQPEPLGNRTAVWHSRVENAMREASELGTPVLITVFGEEPRQRERIEKAIVYSKEFKDWANKNVSLALVRADEGSRDTRFDLWTRLAEYGVARSTQSSMVLVDPVDYTQAFIDTDRLSSSESAIRALSDQLKSKSRWRTMAAVAPPLDQDSPFKVNGGPRIIGASA